MKSNKLIKNDKLDLKKRKVNVILNKNQHYFKLNCVIIIEFSFFGLKAILFLSFFPIVLKKEIKKEFFYQLNFK